MSDLYEVMAQMPCCSPQAAKVCDRLLLAKALVYSFRDPSVEDVAEAVSDGADGSEDLGRMAELAAYVVRWAAAQTLH